MKTLRNPRYLWGEAAFSLVEMTVVITILVIVMVAGIGLRGDSLAASRRAAVDLVFATADYARTTAIARRKPVVMALAAPADLRAGEDGQYRIGLFQVESEEDTGSGIARTVTALGRWKPLARGISWNPGRVDGAVNPWNSPRLALRTSRGPLQVHGIIITPRGGLSSPTGSAPAVILIGQNGAHPTDMGATEIRLRIGRITGRIYQPD